MSQDLPQSLPVRRQQFAALPCRRSEFGLRVMLITSRGTGRWVLPKGWPKLGYSGADLAALEAFEEAGLEGIIGAEAIGSYGYRKHLANRGVVECGVDVFLLAVTRELDDWPERKQRRRQWFTAAEAAALVDEAELAALLRGLT
ncbi:MAG: NUDIX hydrolase [Acetobacteraceae bacterium]|nr:NUDIX hydrolase [Pseudomonadota bacterium]